MLCGAQHDFRGISLRVKRKKASRPETNSSGGSASLQRCSKRCIERNYPSAMSCGSEPVIPRTPGRIRTESYRRTLPLALRSFYYRNLPRRQCHDAAPHAGSTLEKPVRSAIQRVTGSEPFPQPNRKGTFLVPFRLWVWIRT